MRRRTSAGVALVCLLLAGGAAARTATHSGRIEGWAAAAPVIVFGSVTGVAEHDEGRLRIATVGVSDTLKGADLSVVSVVESRNFASVPPVLEVGRRGVLFLKRARRTSQLRQRAGPGTVYALVGGSRDQLLGAGGPPVGEALEVVRRWITLQGATDWSAEERASFRAATIRASLAAAHPAVAADGYDGLGWLVKNGWTPGDVAAVGRGLRVAGRAGPTRIRMIRAVGESGHPPLAEALRGIQPADLDEQAALWGARRRLGSPVTWGELDLALGRAEPEWRVVAVGEAGLVRGPQALDRIERLLVGDPASVVRVAALDAAVAANHPERYALAEGRFRDDEAPEVRQAAARVLLEMAGEPAIEALGRLVFEAPADAQRQAVTLLRALGSQPEDPVLARVIEKHPDEKIRDIAADGIETHHH